MMQVLCAITDTFLLLLGAVVRRNTDQYLINNFNFYFSYGNNWL